MSNNNLVNQDRNGVRVRVTKWADEGTTVDASCQCFGVRGRTHSTTDCPLYRESQYVESWEWV